MPIIKSFSKKNLWETICKEYETKKIDDETANEFVEYDSAKHSPVFYGYSYHFTKLDDESLLKDFDPTVSNSICVGYSLEIYTPKKIEFLPVVKEKEVKKLNEKEYIEQFVFPVLLPCLELMLAQAKLSKCFERKRTAFNACDFITEYLYKNNPIKPSVELESRRSLTFWEIPFVKEWIALHPRPALPKSLLWTEEEAAVIIQAFLRGYFVRRDPEVQELRKWQRELREENQNIGERVEKFWIDVASSTSASIKNKNSNLPDHSSRLSIKESNR